MAIDSLGTAHTPAQNSTGCSESIGSVRNHRHTQRQFSFVSWWWVSYARSDTGDRNPSGHTHLEKVSGTFSSSTVRLPARVVEKVPDTFSTAGWRVRGAHQRLPKAASGPLDRASPEEPDCGTFLAETTTIRHKAQRAAIGIDRQLTGKWPELSPRPCQHLRRRVAQCQYVLAHIFVHYFRSSSRAVTQCGPLIAARATHDRLGNVNSPSLARRVSVGAPCRARGSARGTGVVSGLRRRCVLGRRPETTPVPFRLAAASRAATSLGATGRFTVAPVGARTMIDLRPRNDSSPRTAGQASSGTRG